MAITATTPLRKRPLLGTYERVMIRHYLWHIQVVLLAVLGVITAIDISGEVSRVWREGSALGPWTGVSNLAQFIAYRILDNGTQVFPVAFVLGIVWAEIAHSYSGQRTMARTAGMSLTRGATALVIIATLSVPIQFLLDNVVRPYAFMSLSEKGLGEYGWRYRRLRAERTEWLAFDGNIVQVRMRDDQEPVLHDLTAYEFSPAGELLRITDAPALSAAEPGDWTLSEARVWNFSSTTGESKPVGYTAHDQIPLEVPISMLWLEYRWIGPKYVPLMDLAKLARSVGIPDNAPHYADWLQIRFAQAFNPGLVSLCMTGIFFLLLDRRGLLVSAVCMLAAGYLGFSVTRVMAVVASYQVLPGVVSIWMPSLCFLALAVFLVALLRRRDDRHSA